MEKILYKKNAALKSGCTGMIKPLQSAEDTEEENREMSNSDEERI